MHHLGLQRAEPNAHIQSIPEFRTEQIFVRSVILAHGAPLTKAEGLLHQVMSSDIGSHQQDHMPEV